MTGEIRGQFSLTGPGEPVQAQVIWYKGGRLQILQHGWVVAGQPFVFHAWTADPGGWVGLLVDGPGNAAPVQVQVTGASLGAIGPASGFSFVVGTCLPAIFRPIAGKQAPAKACYCPSGSSGYASQASRASSTWKGRTLR
ncbi:MAG: hypothetical protein WDM96_02910 [Lacunisphaera sp.]